MRVQKRVGVQRVRNNQAPGGQEGFPNFSSKKVHLSGSRRGLLLLIFQFSKLKLGERGMGATLTVLLFVLEDGGTRRRFKSLRDITLSWGKELW